jgi:hypothetical protein
MDDNDAEQHGTHPHAYEHLLVGWIVGVYREGAREEGDGAPAPVPHHCEHSLAGGPGANSHAPPQRR